MSHYKGGRTHEEARRDQREKIAAFKSRKREKPLIPASHVGHAGELLVCFDFVVRGYNAVINHFPGAPFDVIATVDDRLIRIEVKTVSKARGGLQKDRTAREPRLEYRYEFRNSRLERGFKTYIDRKVDIMAFVALDVRKVIYVLANKCSKQVSVRVATFPKRADDSLDRILEEMKIFS